MDTIRLQTKIWNDEYFAELTRVEKIAFLYFLTNEHVNICGCYRIQGRTMKFESGLNDQELESVKVKFAQDNKIWFIDDYVLLINFHKHQKFAGSATYGVQKNVDKLPDHVKPFYELAIDRKCDPRGTQGVPWVYPSTITITFNYYINNNIVVRQENVDNPPAEEAKPQEPRVVTKPKKSVDNLWITEAIQVLETWNNAMGTKLSSYRPWVDNFKKWREDFEFEKILEAVKNIPRHEWLKDKATPVIFFRTDKDWIDQCLNLGAAPGKPVEIPTDFY